MTPSPELITSGFSPRIVGASRIAIDRGEITELEPEPGLPLIVGEAPGQKEDETGIPFHPEAEAGGLLTRLLTRVGVAREQFNVVNVVRQRPPHNELYNSEGNPLAYTHAAIDYWKPALHATIEELAPPVIVGLGRTALETLTGFSDMGTTRGYVCEARIDLSKPDSAWELGDDPYDRRNLHIPIISTYHPAFLNRGQHHLDGVFLRDVLAALEIGQKGWHPPDLRVTPMPSIGQFQAFCRDFNPDVHALTADIETPNSRGLDEDTIDEALAREKVQLPIDRMSFCYASEVGGYSIPFEEPFLTLAQQLIRRAQRLRGWNWRLFDWLRLLQHGFSTAAREYDLMDQWRHMHRTLPASVAFVAPFYLQMSPWKHEAHTQPEYYSAMDAIVEHEVAEGMEREMRASGQWDVYERHVVDIISTNHGVCTQMARNGLPIDQEKIAEFSRELEGKRKERTERLSALVPDSVKAHDPKNGYKTLPKKIREAIAANKLRGYVEKKAKDGKKQHWFTLVIQDYRPPKEKLSKAERVDWQDSLDAGISEENVTIRRWTKRFDFLTSSPPQVGRLIKHFGHKAKTDRKTKEDTTGDDTLKSLIQKYAESRKESDQTAVECYRLIRECRAIDKVLGTYVKGWKPGSDGLIHAIPGIWGDMFRISWRRPNLAATVADKKEIQIAAGFRKCICVPDDQVIVEADWKGMESVIVAHLAGDADYMRLARYSPHAYLASHVIGRPAELNWADDDLSAYLSAIKNDPRHAKVYDDCKHCIHGISYGMTAFLMAELYEMSRSKAQWYIDFFFELFPKVRKWQQATMQEAHDRCRLVNPWGYRMPFWQVFAWNQKRFERLRTLWVRWQTNPQAVFTKSEREAIAKIAASDAAERDAIASLCYDLGDEAKSAISFLPRDIGAAMLKDALNELDRLRLARNGALRTCTHDSIMAICRKVEVDAVAQVLKGVMERPQPLLGGLSIGVDVAMGQSWDKKAMKKWEASLALSA